MAEANGLDIEKKRWYKNASAIFALVAAASGAYIGFVNLFDRVTEEAPPVVARENNIAIVLDTSEEMERSWESDGTTTSKWNVAKNALHEAVVRYVRDEDNLAFRVFPGESGGTSERRLDFGQHKAMFVGSEELPEALQDVEFRGVSEPHGAIIDATGDFQTLQNMPDGSRGKRKLLVVTASLGTRFPLSEKEYCRDVERHIEEAELDVEGSTLSFVALGFTHAEELALTECASTAGADAHFASSESEAVQILDQVLGDKIIRTMTPSTSVPPATSTAPAEESKAVRVPPTPPQRLKVERPSYPCAAWPSRQAGVVHVEATVDAKGDVINVRVIQSVHDTLDKAAADAVRRWKYIPATLGGQPVQGISVEPLNFVWPHNNPCRR